MNVRNAEEVFMNKFFTVQSLCNYEGFWQLMYKHRWLVPGHEETSILFMREIDRFDPFDYAPSIEDVTQVRRKTTGVVESKFNIAGKKYLVVDQGGARSERKKVCFCFYYDCNVSSGSLVGTIRALCSSLRH
jgi:hypothetical protein